MPVEFGNGEAAVAGEAATGHGGRLDHGFGAGLEQGAQLGIAAALAHAAVDVQGDRLVLALLLLWGLWRRRDLKRLKLFLGAIFIIMALLTLLTKHLLFPGTVTDANVGWWERAYAIVLVGWMAVAAIVLDRRLGRRSAA